MDVDKIPLLTTLFKPKFLRKYSRVQLRGSASLVERAEERAGGIPAFATPLGSRSSPLRRLVHTL